MLPRGLGRLIAIAVGLAAGAALAQEADLATDIDGPTHAAFGSTVGFTVTYSNLGPDASDNSYVDLFIPSGLFGPIDQIPDDVFDALQASAEGPDSLGNFPLLFIEDGYCEHLRLQLQGPDWPDGADPVAGLDPGVSGSFSFELPMPMEPPKIGTLIITEPAQLAQQYLPGMTVNQLFRDAVADHRFGRGGDCDDVEPDCQVPSDCFGTRLSLIEAFEAEIEVVDDGGVEGDPSLGCGPLVGFTAGRIAVARRGICPFGDKYLFSAQAGAAAVIVVNDGRCSSFPASDDCAINMEFGVLVPTDVPILMLPVSEGEPIISELESGGAVRAVMGAVPSETFKLDSTVFQFGNAATIEVTEPERSAAYE